MFIRFYEFFFETGNSYIHVSRQGKSYWISKGINDSYKMLDLICKFLNLKSVHKEWKIFTKNKNIALQKVLKCIIIYLFLWEIVLFQN